MKPLERVFKALSSETRLMLLKLLFEEEELSVTAITERLNMSFARVSRNLGILENVGLLKNRQAGTWVFYSIDHSKSSVLHDGILELLEEALHGVKL